MGITFASGANDRSMHGRVRKFVNLQQPETGLVKSMDHRRDLPLKQGSRVTLSSFRKSFGGVPTGTITAPSPNSVHWYNPSTGELVETKTIHATASIGRTYGKRSAPPQFLLEIVNRLKLTPPMQCMKISRIGNFTFFPIWNGRTCIPGLPLNFQSWKLELYQDPVAVCVSVF